MEKRLASNIDIFPCNCGNAHVLLNGCLCDVCMGVAYDGQGEKTERSAEKYDLTYFEALERLFENFEFAA